MTSKFIYKGIDITLDTYEKIRMVVEIIAEKENLSFDEAYELFSTSNAYWCLQTPATLMWAESAEFIVDEFYREKVA